VVCFGYPNVYHHRVAGFTGCDRYSWLPAPSGVQYREGHLMPGEGGDVLTTDSEHPFATYIDAFRGRLSYRAYFAEGIPGFDSFGRVFARSAGGAAVGVELQVDAGRVLFVPPVRDPGGSMERHPLAEMILGCLRRLLDAVVEGPAPSWVKEYALPGLADLEAKHEAAAREVAEAEGRLVEAKARLQELDKFRRLLWQEGKYGLEAVAREALRLLGFQVTHSLDEPCVLYSGGERILLEVEGSPETVGMEPHYRLRGRLEEAIAGTGKAQRGALLVNGHRLMAPESRPSQYADALRVASESMRYCLFTSAQLFDVVRRHMEGDQQAAEAFRQQIAACEGVLALEDILAAEQPHPQGAADPAS
jgi:hypothetical protein